MPRAVSIDNLTKQVNLVTLRYSQASDLLTYHGDTLNVMSDGVTGVDNAVDTAFRLLLASNDSDMLLLRGDPAYDGTFLLTQGYHSIVYADCIVAKFTLNVADGFVNPWYGDQNMLKLGFVRRKAFDVFSGGGYSEQAMWINHPQAVVEFGTMWGDRVDVMLPYGVSGSVTLRAGYGCPSVALQDPSTATGFINFTLLLPGHNSGPPV